MSIIRWKGLAGFVVIVALIVGFFWFFAEGLIKSAIEEYGTDAVGARVSVDEVQLSTEPFGFALLGVAVADPDKPMQNIFEFTRAEGDLNFLRLFMGQVIVDKLAVEKLQLNTARKTSGAISKEEKDRKAAEEKKEREESFIPTPEVKLPTADEIIAREKLITQQRKEEWDVLYAEKKAAIEEVNSRLPKSDQLKKYEEDIKVITEGKIKNIEDLAERKKRLDAVKEAIKHDKEALSDAKRVYTESRKELTAQLKLLKDAPQQDYENLKSKYQINEAGAGNLSQVLFGDKAGEMTRQALDIYTKVKPLIETSEEEKASELAKARAAGEYIHYPTDDPLPDFLIREASIGVILAIGTVDAKLIDITHQQNITGRPTRLKAQGRDLKRIASLSIDGVFDHRKPSTAIDEIKFDARGVQINELSVSGDTQMQISLDSAKADIQGKVAYAQRAVSGEGTAEFSETRFVSTSDASAGRALGRALAEVSQFQLEAAAKGALDDIDFSVKSDLDRRLKDAMKASLSKRQEELQLELKQKLQAKIADEVGAKNDALTELFGDEANLDGQLGKVNELLEAKLDSLADQKKEEAKEKLKSKLFKKLF